MSIQIPIDNLSDEQKGKIDNDLCITLKSSYGMFENTRHIYPYEIVNNQVTIPFAFGTQVLGVKRPTRNSESIMNVNFTGELREEQKIVQDEAIQILNKHGSIIIGLHVGFGKTILSIKLACMIKLKTLVVVNKLVLIKQWEESIKTFCPLAKIQKLTTKSSFDESADFFIMNAINIPKMGRTFFSLCKTLIIDESHCILAEKLSNLMLYVQPRYLIGLSATPERYDGLNILFDLYFGKFKIVRVLHHKHTVYRVDTGFKPKVELSINGKVNWNIVLDSQSKDLKRNELIISIVKKHSDRVFLILVKRIEQGNFLLKRLKEENEHVDSLLGTQQEFDKTCRVLIGTSCKVGVGFDFDRLNALILACDIEAYFIQFLGRVSRKKDNHPLIFDLVDTNPILEKHFKTRRMVYQKHGGIIHKYL